MTFPISDLAGQNTGRSQNIRVALVQSQFRPSTENFDSRDHNLEHVLPMIREAAASGAKLVAVGELFLQGPGSGEWGARYATVADRSDRHVAELMRVAVDLDLTIVMGCIARGPWQSGDVFNAALAVTPDGGVGFYAKMHLANFPWRAGVSNELSFYSAGSDARPMQTPAGLIGVHVCYDIFFPEVSRVQALSGAQYLLNLAATGEGFEPYWDHLCWARAAENGLWYLMCSVVGSSKERDTFGRSGVFGGSRIVAPDGEVILRARDYEEDILVADIDLERSWRMRSETHFLSVRQPDAYRAISEPKFNKQR